MENTEKYIDSIRHLRLLIVSVVVIMIGTFGAGAVVALVSGSSDVSESGSDKTDNRAEITENIGMKCSECGIVESKREVIQSEHEIHPDAVGQTGSSRNTNLVKSYEVTLRMKDGRSHQFMDANGENWRLGERVILISRAK